MKAKCIAGILWPTLTWKKLQKISIYQKSKRYTIFLMLKLKNMENYVDFYRPGLIKTKAFWNEGPNVNVTISVQWCHQ